MRERRERAHGPYRRGRLWRVVETGATGAKSTCSFASEAEAVAYIERFNLQADGRTVSATIDAYLEHVRGLGRADGTIDTIGYRLHGIMRDVEKDRPLRKVTPVIARQLYAQRVAERKPDTHIGELNTASGMFAWALEQGWVSANPFADVAPVGRRGARRTKLRIEETRAFVDHALADGRPEGVAAAMAVLMGMRATEVTSRVVRDVDDGCRVLWIDEDGGTKLKTESSERHLEIPSDLRPYVLRLIMGKKPTDKIFGDVDRHWLRYHVQRLSKAVGNRVTTQALRRTHTKISARLVSVEHVAQAIGHTPNSPVTKKHYIGKDGVERRRTAGDVERVLKGRR